MFNPQKYWDNRLRNNFSIEGVGDITLGEYNKYLYKVRKYVFNKVIKKLNIKIKSFSITDIGAGTGFYIDLWDKAGAKEIKGYDISNHSVCMLTKRFSGNKFTFDQFDIGSNNVENLIKTDIVSTFDVLYHIVDNENYNNAFSNVNKLLNINGYFIFSDNLIRNENEYRIEHQVCRTKKHVFETLKNNGFILLFKTPMFYLMNTSFYPKNVVQKYSFSIISRLIYKCKKLAGFIGFLVYPFEIIFVTLFKNSRSTEIIVCKKVEEV